MKSNIKKEWRLTLSHIGVLMMVIGVVLLIPLLTILFYPNEYVYILDFAIPSIISISIGYLLKKKFNITEEGKMSVGHDAIIVVMTWIFAIFFSAMPFILSGMLNFTQGIFEATSGWTTTGLSVIDVEHAPKIILIHRSIMQFFGGVGIVLIILSALSSTFGMRLYSSEGHSDKLLPNLLKSSRMILSIYTGYVIMGTILYCIFGMPLFDAINHSIASVSTGGFSVKSESIGAYKSIPIELVTIILMILGTTNFAAHLLLINKRFREFFRLSEIKFMFILLGLLIPIVSFSLFSSIYDSLLKSTRIALFEVVSALSTTGYSTVTYSKWNSMIVFIMIIIMLIGGGAGSTSGGIKLYRVCIILKEFRWKLKKIFLPEHIVNKYSVQKTEGRVIISKENTIDIMNYTMAYFVIFIIGTGIITAYGYPIDDAMFEFASSLGTVGLSRGITSIDAPGMVLWIQTIGMMFGRLEIWVVFISIIKIIKDIKLNFNK